jgi:hypothetical protein
MFARVFTVVHEESLLGDLVVFTARGGRSHTAWTRCMAPSELCLQAYLVKVRVVRLGMLLRKARKAMQAQGKEGKEGGVRRYGHGHGQELGSAERKTARVEPLFAAMSNLLDVLSQINAGKSKRPPMEKKKKPPGTAPAAPRTKAPTVGATSSAAAAASGTPPPSDPGPTSSPPLAAAGPRTLTSSAVMPKATSDMKMKLKVAQRPHAQSAPMHASTMRSHAPNSLATPHATSQGSTHGFTPPRASTGGSSGGGASSSRAAGGGSSSAAASAAASSAAASTSAAAPVGSGSLRQHSNQASQPPKAHVNKRLKDVQDYLRENVGDSFTLSELLSSTGHDLRNDEELLQRLRNAPLVHLEEDAIDASAMRLRYKPRHEGVRDRTTLLNFVRDKPQGTFKDELEDCYKGEEAGEGVGAGEETRRGGEKGGRSSGSGIRDEQSQVREVQGKEEQLADRGWLRVWEGGLLSLSPFPPLP